MGGGGVYIVRYVIKKNDDDLLGAGGLPGVPDRRRGNLDRKNMPAICC